MYVKCMFATASHWSHLLQQVASGVKFTEERRPGQLPPRCYHYLHLSERRLSLFLVSSWLPYD